MMHAHLTERARLYTTISLYIQYRRRLLLLLFFLPLSIQKSLQRPPQPLCLQASHQRRLTPKTTQIFSGRSRNHPTSPTKRTQLRHQAVCPDLACLLFWQPTGRKHPNNLQLQQIPPHYRRNFEIPTCLLSTSSTSALAAVLLTACSDLQN